MWPVRVRDRVGRLNQWKSYLVLASMFVVILVAIHLTHYDNAYKKLIMTRQLMSADERFIEKYFREFPDSSLFGRGKYKEDMLQLILDAENVVWDVDEVVLGCGKTADLLKKQDPRAPKIHRVQAPGFTDWSFVFNPEFKYLLDELKKKQIFFYTAAQEAAEDYRREIENLFGDERKFEIDRNFFLVNHDKDKDDDGLYKELERTKIDKTQKTVVIDNVISNWRLDFDYPGFHKYRGIDLENNIDMGLENSVLDQMSAYNHKKQTNTHLIWAKQWFPKTLAGERKKALEAAKTKTVSRGVKRDSECVGASCGRGCLVM